MNSGNTNTCCHHLLCKYVKMSSWETAWGILRMVGNRVGDVVQILTLPNLCDLWQLSPLFSYGKWISLLAIYYMLVARSTKKKKGLSDADLFLLCNNVGIDTGLLEKSMTSISLTFQRNLSRVFYKSPDSQVSLWCVSPCQIENNRAVRYGCEHISLPLDLAGNSSLCLSKILP